tara:strand:- start:17067 stop:17690 length:624 start_codon:yes stop_codon:yes gene_type:complete
MPSVSTSTSPSPESNKQRQKFRGILPNESSSAATVLKSMLLPDEEIILVGDVSSAIYWQSVAVLCASIVFMLLMLTFGLPNPLMILFGTALTIKVFFMFTIATLTKHYLLLAATDKRVITRVGIINLEVTQTRYAQIESSEVASTIPGRFFSYSSVFINGTGGRTLAIPYISNAGSFRKAVTEILSHRDDAELTANERMAQKSVSAI